MNKKLVIGLIFVGLMSFTLIPLQADNYEGAIIDLVVYLETPEKQMVVDEIIDAAEECGLIVNTIYVDFATWIEYAHVTRNYDLLYGPYMSVPKDMDIFFMAFFNTILHSVIPNVDKKWAIMVNELYGMYYDAMVNPDLITEDYLDDMIKIFNKIELRLWAKQFFTVFCHFEVAVSMWGPIPTMETEAMNFNCDKGRVFFDTDLRIALAEKIDRQVFLDYYNTYTSFEAYEIYHIYQNQLLHDVKLPICNP